MVGGLGSGLLGQQRGLAGIIEAGERSNLSSASSALGDREKVAWSLCVPQFSHL